MKIDIVTKDQFILYDESMRIILKDIRNELQKAKELIFQFNDRLRILEVKNENVIKTDDKSSVSKT